MTVQYRAGRAYQFALQDSWSTYCFPSTVLSTVTTAVRKAERLEKAACFSPVGWGCTEMGLEQAGLRWKDTVGGQPDLRLRCSYCRQ